MKIQENIASEFDEFSNNYTEDMIKCVPHYLQLIKSIAKAIPAGFDAEKILDLGCGNGNTTFELLKRFPDAAFTLIDASQEMIEICKGRFPQSKMNYVFSYFQDWAFPEEEFDIISAGFSLHHLDSQGKKWIFPKIFKALKKGGIFTSSDLMINKYSTEHPVLIEEWKSFVHSNYPDDSKWKWLMEHYDTFDSPDSYMDQEKWLLESGFSNVDIGWREGFWCNYLAFK